jgi:hypothetical protein
MCSAIARTTLCGLADRPPVGTSTQTPRNEKATPKDGPITVIEIPPQSSRASRPPTAAADPAAPAPNAKQAHPAECACLSVEIPVGDTTAGFTCLIPRCNPRVTGRIQVETTEGAPRSPEVSRHITAKSIRCAQCGDCAPCPTVTKGVREMHPLLHRSDAKGPPLSRRP